MPSTFDTTSKLNKPGNLSVPVSTRVWWVDLVRGLACISMPFYHITYNLYTMGFTQTAWNKTLFWKIWQTTGLSTFILVSGIAFMLSTVKGIRWQRLVKRAGKLGTFAVLISFVTWFVMPEKFVRFGVLHFFTLTVLLAPLFRPLRVGNLLLGAAIVLFYQWMGRSGLFPEPWLYITGMMSERPGAMDYVPLTPWFGVFLLGMGAGSFINSTRPRSLPGNWAKPVIWLGQHSLSFYFLHQALIYGVMAGLAFVL